tara:strand:+ start:778 stop:1143 length:366 start_codon:yes stop_codon:yes gene_type:complete
MDTDKTLWKTIYKNNKKREQQKIKIYNTILSKCEKKIRWHAQNDQFQCFYEIPIFCMSCPLYNVSECVFFIVQKLQTKFKIHYFSPEDLKNAGIAKNDNITGGILYISWIHIKDKINKLFY